MKCLSCGRTIPNGSSFCNRCGAAQGQGTAIPESASQTKKTRRANGEGTVYRRGKKWGCKVRIIVDADPLSETWQEGKKPKIKSKTKDGFETKAEAKAAIPKLRENLLLAAKGDAKDKRNLTVAYYWASYEKNTLSKLSKSKQKDYRAVYNRLEPFWNWRISDLTVNDLRSIAEKTCKSYDITKNLKTVLNHLFELAAADGVANRDLPSFVVLPQKNEKERQPFTQEEAALVFESWEHGNLFAGYVILMMCTGMMPGELSICKKSMINLENKLIVGAGIKTKQRREQAIVLPDFVIPILQKLMDESPGENLLPKMSTSTFHRMFHSFLAQIGCRPSLTPYSCRHTTATILALDPSLPLSAVSRVMRHSNKMTEHYVHVGNADALKAVSRISRLFEEKNNDTNVPPE